MADKALKKFEINDKEKWYGQEVEVNSDPIDPNDSEWGTKKVILREFKFKFNPQLIKEVKNRKRRMPSEQELFNVHAKQIRLALWQDGLVVNEDVSPRMTVNKAGYNIFVTSVPKKLSYHDKPQKLKDLL